MKALGFVALLAACTTPPARRLPTDMRWSELVPRRLAVGERQRDFLLLVPAVCRGRADWPLVLVLHRRGGSAAQAARDYGCCELAEREGFVVAFPEAKTPWAWSAGGIPLGDAAADLEFLVALLDTLARELPIDPRRVYCCGHSSGGIMTYDLAAHVPGRLAAIGVVAGSIGARGQHGRRAPSGPAVPLLHVHGTGDEQIPYDREHAAGARYDFFVSAPDSVAAWAARNGCSAVEHEDRAGGRHRIDRHRGGGGDVELHTLVDGPHAWPTAAATAGTTSGTTARLAPFDAAAELWRFFREHPRP